jgi:YceI-like domain
VTLTCTIHRAGVAALAVILCGCPTHPRPVASPAQERVPGPPAVATHEGRPYDVQARESLLTVRAYRGGALAKAGHNHVIADHNLLGTFYVPEDPLRASFELRVAVGDLTVDESQLRAAEGDPVEFPPDVPESALEGTRRNMLGEALLDGAHYPEVVLRAERLERAPGSDPNRLLAHVQVTIRGQAHSILVPVRFELRPGEVVASGELALKQSELGLVPFSALLGALQVQDEMKLRFRIVARSAT